MHKTRLKDKRPIGKLLGDAVTSAVQSLNDWRFYHFIFCIKQTFICDSYHGRFKQRSSLFIFPLSYRD